MKMIFKQLLPLLCLFFSSCVKEYSFEKPEPYFLTYKANGATKSAKVFGAGDFTDPANGAFSIFGTTDAVSTSGQYNFGFELVNTAKIVKPGTYTDTDSVFQLFCVYTDSSRSINYLAGTPVAQSAASQGITIQNHFTVTVTSFAGYAARGTFSGDFYDNGDLHGEMVKITEGRFYIKMR